MRRLLLLGVIAVVCTHPPNAFSQMKLSPMVVAPGNTSASGSVQMFGVVGQPVIGLTSDPPVDGYLGFVYPVYDYLLGTATAVIFSSIDAHIEDRTVVINWLMPVAGDVHGFNVYRRDGPEGELERLNAVRILPDVQMTYDDDTIRPGRKYEYLIGAIEGSGESFSLPVFTTVPAWKTELQQNYPNPFNPSTTIPFYLAESGDVSIRVYNVKGQLVRKLAQERFSYGRHELSWDGTTDRGMPVASGVYFYRLVTRGESFTKRMMILK